LRTARKISVAIARWVAAVFGICLSLVGMLGLTRMLRNRFLSGDFRTLTFEAPWLFVTSPLLSAVFLLLFRNWVYAAFMVFPVAWWLASIPLMSHRGHSDNDVSVELNAGAVQQVLVWTSVGATSIAAALTFTRLLAGPHPISRTWWWPAPLLTIAAWGVCRVANLGVSLIAGALGASSARRAYGRVVSAAPLAAAESPQAGVIDQAFDETVGRVEATPVVQRSWLSLVSLGLGLLSTVFGLLWFGIPAMVIGYLALRRKEGSKKMAIGGLVLGAVAVAAMAAVVILVLTGRIGGDS